jgi:hypothetical protein
VEQGALTTVGDEERCCEGVADGGGLAGVREGVHQHAEVREKGPLQMIRTMRACHQDRPLNGWNVGRPENISNPV